MLKDMKYDEIQKNDKNNFLLIDVRSPKEFEEATILGAINIPLFNNEEREKIGTIYKQKGPEVAKILGVEIVSPKIPSYINEINKSLEKGQIPVFFCWRGGMRSKTMATLFDLIHTRNVYRLEGGYRAYREYILNQIAHIDIQIPTFVLHGMTGVGKTILLDRLQEKGIVTMDLEGLAGHRGSIFGGIGSVKPVNQKTFDSKIYEEIKKISKQDYVVIEAESKRIGKVVLPENIINAKETGYHVMVSASVEKRVERIIAEYNPHDNKEAIYEAIKGLERRLPTEIRKEILTAYEKEDFPKIVELLLIHYYDPRYQHSTEQYHGPFFEVNSDNIDKAVQEIADYVLKTTEVILPV